jgi:hypothetical protein
MEEVQYREVDKKAFTTLYKIRCSNYSSCPVRPQLRSSDAELAVTMWNSTGTDEGTGEIECQPVKDVEQEVKE